MDLGLRHRACVITGASGGIGRATAVALAAGWPTSSLPLAA